MGGAGSGRYSFCRATTTNDMLDIDLAWLRKQGILERPYWSTLTWSRGGQTHSSVCVIASPAGLLLSYTLTDRGEKKSITETIPFSCTDTQFNGRRQWFQCPSCRKNCRVIYGGEYFRCRLCYGLKYESQYEKSFSRVTDRALKIRRKLDDYGCIDDPFPEKPKGMHWKTYNRLRADYECGVEDWGRLCLQWLRR